MNETKKVKASEVKKQADALLENGGVGTRERFMQALPLLFSLKEAAAALKQFVKALEASADELSRQAAGYAEEHVTALDTPLAEVREGIRNGTVEIDGTTYRLTVSPDKIKRLDGGTLTQTFLKGLPKDWTKAKFVLVDGAFKDLGAEELAKHDLCREIKREWSVAAKAA